MCQSGCPSFPSLSIHRSTCSYVCLLCICLGLLDVVDRFRYSSPLLFGCQILYCLTIILLYSCLDTTFEVQPQFISWHDASVNNRSHWSLENALQSHFVSIRPIHSDHTYQHYSPLGHYMLYVGWDSQTAAILSTTVAELNVCGIRFWYYLEEKSSHKLEIFVTVSPDTRRQLYSSKGETAIEGIWQYTEVVAPISLFGSEVSFVSTLGADSLSPFALDDIQLTQCPGQYMYTLHVTNDVACCISHK